MSESLYKVRTYHQRSSLVSLPLFWVLGTSNLGRSSLQTHQELTGDLGKNLGGSSRNESGRSDELDDERRRELGERTVRFLDGELENRVPTCVRVGL
jgi:hypothetical protein